MATQTSVFSNLAEIDRQHLGQNPCNCIEFTTFHHTKLYSFENLSLAFVKIVSQFRKF